MNDQQKKLTWIALAAFALTLLAAPWEVTDFAAFDNATAPHISRKAYAPIWSAPTNNYGKSEIQVSTLFVEWIAIGIIYAGISSVIKKRAA